jgi:hypothetical protein
MNMLLQLKKDYLTVCNAWLPLTFSFKSVYFFQYICAYSMIQVRFHFLGWSLCFRQLLKFSKTLKVYVPNRRQTINLTFNKNLFIFTKQRKRRYCRTGPKKLLLWETFINYFHLSNADNLSVGICSQKNCTYIHACIQLHRLTWFKSQKEKKHQFWEWETNFVDHFEHRNLKSLKSKRKKNGEKVPKVWAPHFIS